LLSSLRTIIPTCGSATSSTPVKTSELAIIDAHGHEAHLPFLKRHAARVAFNKKRAAGNSRDI